MIIAVIVLISDFISKLYIANNMQLWQNISIIPGILDITYVKNTGSAWGIMASKPVLLVCVIIIMIIGLIIYLIKAKPAKLEKISIYLIIAGGIGNLISRAVYGYVVDFINIHIIPVFNIADISICVGCGLLLLAILVLEKNE